MILDERKNATIFLTRVSKFICQNSLVFSWNQILERNWNGITKKMFFSKRASNKVY